MLMNFADLIKENKIVIPKIQRDYAQGRVKYNKQGQEIISEKPYQIRTGLVNALYLSLKGDKKVDLNFVYGKKLSIDEVSIFIPIDGQQRLTTLFLLHWYIYQKANLAEEVKKLGERFSYDTRETTKNFCNEICQSIILYGEEESKRIQYYLVAKDSDKKYYKLSSQLTDKIWFTSSYENDPSVKSMLTMLDTIEAKFIFDSKFKSEDDFKKIAFVLQDANNCPITFSYLDVQNFDDEDMYIKMNARGKELTDFEIFKARLEEGKVLQDVCYSENDSKNDRENKKVEFIGKYNNEFTNLFYGIHEIGKDLYDDAIFRFMECFIRMDHYAEITARTKISEEYYYEGFSNTNYTGALLFNDYVLNPSLHGYKKENYAIYVEMLKKKAKYSLRKITDILQFFSIYGFDILPEYKNSIKDNTVTYDEKQLVIISAKGAPSLHLVVMHALLSFLSLMECKNEFENKKDAYLEWKRFVCNITYRFSVKDPVNFAKMAGVFEEILLKIQEVYESNGKVICATNILEIITKYKDIPEIASMPMEVIRYPFDREAYKANLMLDPTDGFEWGRCIREAEEYYYDGDIDFIFRTVDKQLTPISFNKAFHKSIQWLDRDKTPIDEVSLNEALLCIEYPETAKEMAHLKIYSYGESWQLYYGKQNSVRDALTGKERNMATLDGLIELFKNYDASITPREYADRLIEEYSNIPNCWLRNVLVKERIILNLKKYCSRWPFSGTIGLWSQTVPNEYVLFYKTAYNSYNLELNTFRLAMNLIENYSNLEVDLCSGKPRNRERRFVKINDRKVSYDMQVQRFYNIDCK